MMGSLVSYINPWLASRALFILSTNYIEIKLLYNWCSKRTALLENFHNKCLLCFYVVRKLYPFLTANNTNAFTSLLETHDESLIYYRPIYILPINQCIVKQSSTVHNCLLYKMASFHAYLTIHF